MRIKLLGIAIMLMAALAVGGASAQSVPLLLNYQGKLTDATGAPLATANYTLTFRIYDDALGGTLIWGPQIFDGNAGAGHGPQIPVVNGFFNVVLGPVDANLPSSRSLVDAFRTGSSRFLEVTVASAPAPISPRQQVLSSAFAVQAEYAEYAKHGVPPGTILPFGGSTIPVGYLDCNGAEVSRATYSSLFAAIATTWGSGNGSTTFNLPDFRGRFLRGFNNGSGRDPNAGTRTACLPGGPAGDSIGTCQDDLFESHAHSVFSNNASGAATGGNANYLTNIPPQNQVSTATGGAETRPINASVRYIVKY